MCALHRSSGGSHQHAHCRPQIQRQSRDPKLDLADPNLPSLLVPGRLPKSLKNKNKAMVHLRKPSQAAATWRPSVSRVSGPRLAELLCLFKNNSAKQHRILVVFFPTGGSIFGTLLPRPWLETTARCWVSLKALCTRAKHPHGPQGGRSRILSSGRLAASGKSRSLFCTPHPTRHIPGPVPHTPMQ